MWIWRFLDKSRMTDFFTGNVSDRSQFFLLRMRVIDHSTMQIGDQHYSEIVKAIKKYLTTDCSLQDICKNFRYAQSRS